MSTGQAVAGGGSFRAAENDGFVGARAAVTPNLVHRNSMKKKKNEEEKGHTGRRIVGDKEKREKRKKNGAISISYDSKITSLNTALHNLVIITSDHCKTCCLHFPFASLDASCSSLMPITIEPAAAAAAPPFALLVRP